MAVLTVNAWLFVLLGQVALLSHTHTHTHTHHIPPTLPPSHTAAAVNDTQKTDLCGAPTASQRREVAAS